MIFLAVNYVIAKVLNTVFRTPTSTGLKVAFIITKKKKILKYPKLNFTILSMLKFRGQYPSLLANYLLPTSVSRRFETRSVVTPVPNGFAQLNRWKDGQYFGAVSAFSQILSNCLIRATCLIRWKAC